MQLPRAASPAALPSAAPAPRARCRQRGLAQLPGRAPGAEARPPCPLRGAHTGMPGAASSRRSGHSGPSPGEEAGVRVRTRPAGVSVCTRPAGVRVRTRAHAWTHRRGVTMRLAPPGRLSSLAFFQKRTEPERLAQERQPDAGLQRRTGIPARKRTGEPEAARALGFEPSAKGGAAWRRRGPERKRRAGAAPTVPRVGRVRKSDAGNLRSSSSDSLPAISTSADNSVPLPAVRETCTHP